MTDHDFELRLRADLRELVEPASAAMRASVIAIPDEVSASLGRRLTTGWRFPAMLRFAPLALAAAAVVIAMVGIGQLVRPTNVGPPAPSISPSAPAASTTEGELVYGWPETGRNGRGHFSWDGATCGSNAGAECFLGFMRNMFGSGDVEIRIGTGGGTISALGGTPVTVAGHDATYQGVDARREEWLVDIEGTTYYIRLWAEPGTSEADLAEAHAIIDSMRTEPRANDLGFRLVFTLRTDDWSSGGWYQRYDGPPAASATPSAPTASATEGERVNGWPLTTASGPGLYSWNGPRGYCAGSCNRGWMHNGYGSSDVEIRITEGPNSGGGTAITVAGHDGVYRRIDALREEWVVDIEGTTITIQLTAKQGTSEADLAEAHAIIDSMYAEPRDTDLGFRLVFRLATDDWDSG